VLPAQPCWFILDGNTHSARNPNENNAREILERHTLGANIFYDEMTFQELAKALIGRRMNLSTYCSGNIGGEVTFHNAQHDNTAKTLVFTCN